MSGPNENAFIIRSTNKQPSKLRNSMIVNSPTAKDGIFPLNSNDLLVSESFKELKNFGQIDAENKKREVHSK